MSPSVQFQQTPNPNAGKFVVDRVLVDDGGSRSVYSPEEAEGDPLSAAIFGIPGVVNLFYAENFVTVTKEESATWEELIPPVSKAIREELD